MTRVIKQLAAGDAMASNHIVGEVAAGLGSCAGEANPRSGEIAVDYTNQLALDRDLAGWEPNLDSHRAALATAEFATPDEQAMAAEVGNLYIGRVRTPSVVTEKQNRKTLSPPTVISCMI